MTRKTQNTATTHNPVTVRVRCMGSYHHVTWRDHRLVLEDHPDDVVKFMNLFDTSCGCMEILRVVRGISENPYKRPKEFPLRLWHELLLSRTALLHHIDQIKSRLQERYIPEKLHIPPPRLQLSTQPPWIAVFFKDKSRPLAIYDYGDQRWNVDWDVAQELSLLIPPRDSTDRADGQCRRLWIRRQLKVRSDVLVYEGCRPCDWQDPYANAIDEPPTPGLVDHAQSPQHRQRIFAAFARVFEVDPPDDLYGEVREHMAGR
jgi:hypothetical protein